MKCTNCNHGVNDGAAFCGNCGASLQALTNPAPYTTASNPVMNAPSSSPLRPQVIQQYAANPPQPLPAYNPMPQVAVAANLIPEVMTAAKATVIASSIMLGLNLLFVAFAGLIMIIIFNNQYVVTSENMGLFLTFVFAGFIALLTTGVWIWLIRLGQQLKSTTSTASAAKLVERLFVITIVIIALTMLTGTIPIAAIIMIIFISKAKDTLARTPLS